MQASDLALPVGNRVQLFDTVADPDELKDLSKLPGHSAQADRLSKILVSQLYGGDEAWAKDGKLVGLEAKKFQPAGNRTMSAQRGLHWPPPPQMDIPQIEWNSEKSAG